MSSFQREVLAARAKAKLEQPSGPPKLRYPMLTVPLHRPKRRPYVLKQGRVWWVDTTPATLSHYLIQDQQVYFVDSKQRKWRQLLPHFLLDDMQHQVAGKKRPKSATKVVS